MKQIVLSLSMAVAAVFLLCGCDNTPVGWLKTDGGYINLNRVCNIESYGLVKVDGKELLNGPLSDENIKSIRETLKKTDKEKKVEVAGSVKFDKDYVMILTERKTVSRDEALKIVDAWADVMDRIADQLP